MAKLAAYVVMAAAAASIAWAGARMLSNLSSALDSAIARPAVHLGE
jgi:hypothetical protein